MNKCMSLNNVLLSTLGALAFFLLTALCVTPAHANSAAGYTAGTTAPAVLAYYYGPGPRYNHGPNWVGPRCSKNCFRNQWGNVRCVRTCN